VKFLRSNSDIPQLFLSASNGLSSEGYENCALGALVTPWGDLNLDSLLGDIDAASALNPGDAFTAGLDAASAAATGTDPLAFLGL
jgi:hypothetical protein